MTDSGDKSSASGGTEESSETAATADAAPASSQAEADTVASSEADADTVASGEADADTVASGEADADTVASSEAVADTLAAGSDEASADTYLASSEQLSTGKTTRRPSGDSREPPEVWSRPNDQPMAPTTRYRVEGEVAHGGLGRILRAHDRWLGRTVAVKELRSGRGYSAPRFRREALVTARLEHPAIVPVHDAGQWKSGAPFYSMKLVSGQSLADAIKKTDSFEARLPLLANVRAVADAMAYAHSQGVIHRDLKPANIMVGAYGETLVIDWGLAKDTSSADEAEEDSAAFQPSVVEHGLTSTGAVLGTPAYMPPEQAHGQVVDERADVYAIGALLYAVLTGGAPFRESDSASTLARVMRGPPPPVGEREPRTPVDLAAIVDKAMARDPGKRYRSAGELAEDLERFQTGQLVSVRQYSLTELLRRWLARHRAAVTVAVIGLMLLVGFGTVAVRRIISEKDTAQAQRRVAQEQKRIAEARSETISKKASEITLLQARSSLATDPTAAVAWLKQIDVDAGNLADVRAIAQRALTRGVALDVLRPSEQSFITGAAWSPDGKLVAATWSKGRILVRDVDAGTTRFFAGGEGVIYSISFSPDGRQIGSAAANGSVDLWDVGSGARRKLGVHRGAATQLAFSPDSRWLVSSAAEQRVLLFDLTNNSERAVVASDGLVNRVAFAPGSEQVATAGSDGTVRLIDVATGDQRILGQHVSEVFDVGFSPDGSRVASAGDDATLRVWSLVDGTGKVLRGHEQPIFELQFAPDSRSIATASKDTTVRVWDVVSGDHRVFRGHTAEAYELAFDREGSTLASSSYDGTVRLWDVATGDSRTLLGHSGTVSVVEYSQDGFLVSADSEGELRIWRNKRSDSRLLLAQGGVVSGLAIARDGKQVATASWDKTIGLIDLSSGEARTFAGHDRDPWAVDFSPDGTTLYSAGADGTVRGWDPTEGTSRVIYRHPNGIQFLTVSRDGAMIAVHGEEGSTVALRLQGSESEATPIEFHDRGDVHAIMRFSTDAHSIALPNGAGDVRIYSASGALETVLAGNGSALYDLQFSPDGQRLAGCSVDGNVRIWDRKSGSSQALPLYCQPTARLAFSPDGSLLAAATPDHAIRVLDARSTEARVLIGHVAPIWRLAFSNDGSRLVSSAEDQTIRVWNLAEGSSRVLVGHTAEVIRVLVSPDNTFLVSAGRDGQVRQWHSPFQDPVPVDAKPLARWLVGVTRMEAMR